MSLLWIIGAVWLNAAVVVIWWLWLGSHHAPPLDDGLSVLDIRDGLGR